MSSESDVRRVGVLIVGAGFSGLGLGALLKRRSDHDFVILERGDDVGGTWRENTYPGIACDVPAQVYSYSFSQSPDWSRVYPSGREIQSYLRGVAEDEGLLDHLGFGIEVRRMEWHEESGAWLCETTGGTYEAKVLVLACGRLSEPHVPQVPGLGSFADGDEKRIVMHSARWRHDVDLADRRVVVVGSGASAIQLVPELAAVAAELTVMQRSAPYIVPRNDRAFSESERRMFRRLPETVVDSREAWFWKQETVFAQRALVTSEVEQARVRALDHLHEQVPDPELRERLTPSYEIGCKRVLLSDDYYPAFSLARVSLLDSELAAVAPGRVIAADGRSRDADVLVLATGFHSSRQPYALRVIGERGLSLDEEWRNGMYAHNSVSVPGFPNMFVMNGPNSGLGHNSAIVMIETQIRYICQALSYMSHSDVRTIRITPTAAERYRKMIDAMSADTVWLRGGCETSWYRDTGTGRLTLLWPGLAMRFREIAGEFSQSDFEVRSSEPEDRPPALPAQA